MKTKDDQQDLPITENNSTTDPLGDIEENYSEQDQETLENHLETNGNESEKDTGNHLEDVETPIETDLEEIQEDGEEELENPENDLENDSEEEIYSTETTEDPLTELEDPEPNPLSKKELTDEYKELLNKWAINGINFLDDLKVQVCIALGGGYASDYAAKDPIKEMFLESTRLLLKEKSVAAPTPMQAFLAALAAMTLPSIVMVSFRRYTQTHTTSRLRAKAEPSDIPQAQTDYTNTIEYQEGRTKFKVHRSGAYQYDLDGEYVSADISDAYPSPEIQKLLDEGKKSSEIKKIIYG